MRPQVNASAAYTGIDFGTSNSAMAVADEAGGVRFAEFSLLGAKTSSYRSLLFFDPDEQEVGRRVDYTAGVEAIEAYLEALGEGRLIQSFKTHLTNEALGRTQIGHHALNLDDMLGLFLTRLRIHTEKRLGTATQHVMFGRPVHFVGAKESKDDELAQSRLAKAAQVAGFKEVRFELEPIAAAYHYEQYLESEELALVADFGGGTTDFCLMRLGPTRRSAHDRTSDIVVTGGVGTAGDDLDAALIEHVVAPSLGKGSTYREMGRERAIPPSYYFKLSHWHHLSFLRSAQTRRELERLARGATNKPAIESLIHVIEANQGFHLHKSVERAKIALSSETETTFDYCDGPVQLQTPVARAEFERWIAPCVSAIASCLDDTLERAGVLPRDVDRVFMTGGTSFVPAVRREFEARFGADKLGSGDELVSIASGLALRARRLWGEFGVG